MATATIANLTVHPIKGIRGVSVARWPVTKTGLRYDREFMVVKDSGSPDVPSKFLSQRELPKLALVVPELPAEVLQQPAAPPAPGASMTLTAPGMPAPLKVALELQPDAPLRTIRVWEWQGKTLDVGDEAAAWISQYLGQPARLVRYVGSEQAAALPAAADAPDVVPVARLVDQEYVESRDVPVPETRLSDGFPMLLANQASMDDLNARIAESSDTGKDLVPLPIQRFRPNVVLAGLEPWAEDKWRTVRFVGAEVPSGAKQDLVWKSVKPCSRCKVTTINPATAEVSEGEPLDTLATFRSGSALGYATKSFKHAVHFAWNLVPAAGQEVHHVLSVGDTVQLADEQIQF